MHKSIDGCISMKLLLIVANFLPEIGSAAHIYHDLGLDLVKRGHEVHVITSYPMEFYLDEKGFMKKFPIQLSSR